MCIFHLWKGNFLYFICENRGLYIIYESEKWKWSCSVVSDSLRSHIHGLLQVRILEWVAISFSRISSQHRDWTQVSHTAGRLFTVWVTKGSKSLSHVWNSPGQNTGVRSLSLLQGIFHIWKQRHILKSGKIFYILYMKGELHNSSMKMVKFPEFHIWMWKCIFHIWSGRISFISYMKIEQLNKVWSTLIMFGWDRVLSAMRTFRPDLVLCALGHGDPGRDLAWPLSWKTPCLHLNVGAQMSGVWGWGGLLWVTMLSSKWGSTVLPGSVLR